MEKIRNSLDALSSESWSPEGSRPSVSDTGIFWRPWERAAAQIWNQGTIGNDSCVRRGRGPPQPSPDSGRKFLGEPGLCPEGWDLINLLVACVTTNVIGHKIIQPLLKHSCSPGLSDLLRGRLPEDSGRLHGIRAPSQCQDYGRVFYTLMRGSWERAGSFVVEGLRNGRARLYSVCYLVGSHPPAHTVDTQHLQQRGAHTHLCAQSHIGTDTPVLYLNVSMSLCLI